MQYLFLDTNIYLNCALIRESGHDLDLLVKLRERLTSSGSVLLLPEVVELEFNRLYGEQLELLRQKMREAQIQVEKLEVLSYVRDEVHQVARAMEKIIERREQSVVPVQDLLGEIFASPSVERLPLTPQLMLQGYRRALSGRRPFVIAKAQSLLDADSMILETLIEFFQCKPRDSLLFCSSNIKDFAEFDQDAKRHTLHHDLVRDLSISTWYYRSLPTLIEEVFQTRVDPAEAAKYEEIQQAQESSPVLTQHSRREGYQEFEDLKAHVSGEVRQFLYSLKENGPINASKFLAQTGGRRASAKREQRWGQLILLTRQGVVSRDGEGLITLLPRGAEFLSYLDGVVSNQADLNMS